MSNLNVPFRLFPLTRDSERWMIRWLIRWIALSRKKKKKKKKTWQIDWATYTQIHTPTVEPQEMVIFCAWHIKNNT